LSSLLRPTLRLIVLNASRVVNAVLNGTVFGEEEAFLFSFIAPYPCGL
jgi:hypothetical protein